jgi:excisionase family DNA binding protein
MPGPAFLTIPEAAVRSRLSVRTLRRAIMARQLYAVRPGGRRRVLIPDDALVAFMYLTTARRSASVDPEPEGLATELERVADRQSV